MRIAYLFLYLLPTLAVLVLGWFVVRAVSVRVTWRDASISSLDDELARAQARASAVGS